MSFNKITLVGNLGRDPELRYTPQGTPVCSFSLATNERRKDKTTGENNDIVTWFRVTLWGRQAETASQYLQRGRPVYIEGRLRVEEWTDRDAAAALVGGVLVPIQGLAASVHDLKRPRGRRGNRGLSGWSGRGRRRRLPPSDLRFETSAFTHATGSPLDGRYACWSIAAVAMPRSAPVSVR